MQVLKPFHLLRRMKLIPKLALSYIATILVCISIVGGFYYQMLQRNIRDETSKLLRNTVLQAKENIKYKVGLYSTMADILYLNGSMQELLFKEYFDPISRAMALESIQSMLLPLIEGNKDIIQLSIYVTNETIVPFEKYLKSIKSIENEEFYKRLPLYDDNIKWILYDERKIPVSGANLPSGINADMNSLQEKSPAAADNEVYIKQLAMVKNLRYLLTGTYLGFLMVRLDIDSIFKDLMVGEKDDSGWFDITDAEGAIIFSGAARSSREENKNFVETLELIHRNYKEYVMKSGSEFSMEINQGKFLVLKEKIDSTGWNIFYVNPVELYQENLKRLQLVTFLLVVICLSLFVLLSWWMALRFSKRIRVLSQSMKLLQTGDFSVQVAVGGNDEIDELCSGFNRMVRDLKKLLDEIHIAKEREKESELKALQAQINPHFLYNTLTSISYLGAQHGADDVARMSNSLAKFYRLSLSKGRNVICIRDEIENIKAYLDIQSARFKNRIHVVYEIDDAVLESCSLKMLLQPFVENAIQHGMWISKKSITIRILIKENNGLVIWKIIDDGVGMTRKRLESAIGEESQMERGYGIINVDRRIKVCFGEQYGVNVFSRPGIGTTVTITTPFIKPEKSSG
jgi:two-component system sensor histidine kinase YesM